MKNILAAILCLLAIPALGANPSFQDFNTNEFSVASNRVSLKGSFSNTLWSASTNTLYPSLNSNHSLAIPREVATGTNLNFGSARLNPSAGARFYGWQQPLLGDLGIAEIYLGASAATNNSIYHYFAGMGKSNSSLVEVVSFGTAGLTAIGRIRTGGSDPAVNSGPSGTNVEFYLQARRANNSFDTLVRLHPTATNAAQTPFHFDTLSTRSGGTLFAISNNNGHAFSITDSGILRGNAAALNTGSPILATNAATATDGQVLSKSGTNLSLVDIGGFGNFAGQRSALWLADGSNFVAHGDYFTASRGTNVNANIDAGVLTGPLRRWSALGMQTNVGFAGAPNFIWDAGPVAYDPELSARVAFGLADENADAFVCLRSGGFDKADFMDGGAGFHVYTTNGSARYFCENWCGGSVESKDSGVDATADSNLLQFKMSHDSGLALFFIDGVPVATNTIVCSATAMQLVIKHGPTTNGTVDVEWVQIKSKR